MEIIKEKYKGLIFSIKEDLKSIEDMRNCIAHNRSFTDTLLENYDKAKPSLDEKIEDFWKKSKNEN